MNWRSARLQGDGVVMGPVRREPWRGLEDSQIAKVSFEGIRKCLNWQECLISPYDQAQLRYLLLVPEVLSTLL